MTVGSELIKIKWKLEQQTRLFVWRQKIEMLAFVEGHWSDLLTISLNAHAAWRIDYSQILI